MIKELIFSGKKWFEDSDFPLLATVKAGPKTGNEAINFQINNGAGESWYTETVGCKLIVSSKTFKIKVVNERTTPETDLGELNARRIFFSKNIGVNEDWYPVRGVNVYIPDDNLTDLQKVTTDLLESKIGGVTSLLTHISRCFKPLLSLSRMEVA